MDEKGFVFIDNASRPFYVQPWGLNDDWWMFYWHPDHKWVSLRKIGEAEWMQFKEKAISRERAELYFRTPDQQRDFRQAFLKTEADCKKPRARADHGHPTSNT